MDLFAFSGLILLPNFARLFTLPFGVPHGFTVNVHCLISILGVFVFFAFWNFRTEFMFLDLLSFIGTIFV